MSLFLARRAPAAVGRRRIISGGTLTEVSGIAVTPGATTASLTYSGQVNATSYDIVWNEVAPPALVAVDGITVSPGADFADVSWSGQVAADSYDLMWEVWSEELFATFDSASELDLFALRSGSWTVSGGSATASVSASGTSHDLRAEPRNLDGGSLTFNLLQPASIPSGFELEAGVSLGDWFKVYFERKASGWNVFVFQWDTWTSLGSLGAYSTTNHSWLRLNFGTDRRVTAQTSANGSTWSTVGVSAPIQSTWSWKAVEPYWKVRAASAIASTSASLAELSASGPSIDDDSHTLPVDAVLVHTEHFASMPSDGWLVDDLSWASAANTTVVGNALRLSVAGGEGSRIYWFTPPNLRFGLYEWRLRLSPATGFGPAVMLWPASDVWTEGEMDVLEGHGSQARMTVHDFPNAPSESPHNQHIEVLDTDMTQWHVIQWEWRPDLLRGWIDGRLVFYSANTAEIPTTNFRIDMHHGPNPGYTPTGTESGYMEVDYVSVYEIPGVTVRRPVTAGGFGDSFGNNFGGS